VDIAAEVGPLAGTEPAVDGDEKRHRCVEKLEVLLVLREASGGIVAIDAERTIELQAVCFAPLLVCPEHWIGIYRVFRLGMARIFTRDTRGYDPLEILERPVRERVDVPRLQVATGCCALSSHDQFAYDVEIDWLIQESAASDARVDRFENIHGSPDGCSLSGDALETMHSRRRPPNKGGD